MSDVWVSCLNKKVLTGKRKTCEKQVCNCTNSILQVLSVQLPFEHPIRVVKYVSNMYKSGTQGKAGEIHVGVV